MTINHFSFDYLGELVQDAQKSPRARQHRNIHQSYEDPCQRFFNAIGVDSYIRPHRHLLDPKLECLIAVRGLFAQLTFDESGGVSDIIIFGTEKYCELDSLRVGVELSPGVWHTVLALRQDSVLLELKAGPFDPTAAKEFASWAPEETAEEAVSYFANLRCCAESVIWEK